MGPGEPLQFTQVTPANYDGLVYHFIINGTDTPTDEPSLLLPDYTPGTTYLVKGYVQDMVSGQQRPPKA